MAKHSKQRAFTVGCVVCGSPFTTGSSIRTTCSLACRMREWSAAFEEGEACWEWPGSRNPQTGYGQLSTWHEGRRVVLLAHRASYEAFVGPIESGMQVLHRCDNRPCFNPRHLFLGTQKANMHDMDAKGRGRRGVTIGTAHHGAKATPEVVREIRAATGTNDELAARYGLSRSATHAIRSGRTWKHVT